MTTKQPVPLPALFVKSSAAAVKVSPRGTYLAWMARADGVLNLWLAPLPLPLPNKSDLPNAVPGARMITASSVDACFYYTFTHDDNRILYLRETEHGSELYHLFCIDILDALERDTPAAAGRDLLAAYPKLTCCVGFVGGLQLWLPRNDPNRVVLSTGRGALLWDLSELDLSAQPCSLRRRVTNPGSTRLGLAWLVLQLLLHLSVVGLCRLGSALTLGLLSSLLARIERLAPLPSAPAQFFVNREGALIGTASVAVGLPAACASLRATLIPGIALRFTRRCGTRWRSWRRWRRRRAAVAVAAAAVVQRSRCMRATWPTRPLT